MTIPTFQNQIFPQRSNALKAALFVLMLACSLIAMSRLALLMEEGALPMPLAALLILCLAFVNGCVILAMLVLAHESVHNVLFRSRLANDLVGGLMNALSLIPHHANRQFHLSHHCYSHQPGLDPECTMHERGFLFAFFIGPHLGIFLQHKKWIENLVRAFRQRRYLWLFLKDTFYLGCAMVYYLGLVFLADVSPLYALLPTALAFTLVFSVRAMSDHYGLPAARNRADRFREIVEQEELETQGYERRRPSGWVVMTHPFIEWFWSHINYHDVHHRYPYLSHANLKAVFEQTHRQHPYTVAQGYFSNLKNLWHKPYFGN